LQKEAFDRDAQKIESYLENDVLPSTNALAIFACSGEREFFEVLQLGSQIPNNQVFVQNKPNLFYLAWLNDHFRRYAVVVGDTMSARVFLLGLGQVVEREEIDNPHPRHTQAGGWSQARYQRRAENFSQKHAQEVADVLEHLVREERVDHIILVGDELAVPAIQSRLNPKLNDKVRVLRLESNAPEDEILKESLEAMRQEDARQDADRAQRLIEEYRSGGLAVAGLHDTFRALANGQVTELVVTAEPAGIEEDEELDPDVMAALGCEYPVRTGDEAIEDRLQAIADALVTRAEQTSAAVSFVEDGALLSSVGGVGAFLRYRI
jgi:peptide subunit release factor 1 (eRF1)